MADQPEQRRPLPIGEALERVTVARARRATRTASKPEAPAPPEIVGEAVAEIGYAARLFAQLALPYRDPGPISEWRRTNGSISLRVNLGEVWVPDGPPRSGLPYGVVPRLLTTWMATEATRTQERTLVLGGSLTSFLAQLGLTATGGQTGSIGRLRDQMTRLFTASFVLSAPRTGPGQLSGWTAGTLTVADEAELWWSDLQPSGTPLWQSTVSLSERFYESIVAAPVPVDLGALRSLRGSALRLDIYTWLTYRMSYLSEPTTIPWESLAIQFGGDYAEVRKFKRDFLRQLAAVRAVYPAVKVEPSRSGLVLRPSPPHVERKRIKRGSTR